MQERLCKVLPRMRALAPLTKVVIEEMTKVVIEEIIESPMDLGALDLKKGKTMLAIEGFTPLVLALPAIVKPFPGFV